MKKCWQCAEAIQDEARVCRFCGAKVPDTRPGPPGGKVVWAVGAGILLVAIFGARLEHDTTTSTGTPQQATPESLLEAKPISAQQDILAKVVASGGDTCPSSNQTMHVATVNGMDLWDVRCNSTGKSFSVSFDKDGNTKVLDCSILATMGTQCWKKLD